VNTTFRLLASLLRKVPVGVLLLVAEYAVAWLGKRSRLATKCKRPAASLTADPPDAAHNGANEGRP
jgi:hypothetical protein